jgi:hypothetical protein
MSNADASRGKGGAAESITGPCAFSAHSYRASVRFRWQGVHIPGLGSLGGKTANGGCEGRGLDATPRKPRFKTPGACLEAARRGEARVLDAEEMVERQLRTVPADVSMFTFLAEVVFLLAQSGAACGVRLAGIEVREHYAQMHTHKHASSVRTRARSTHMSNEHACARDYARSRMASACSAG